MTQHPLADALREAENYQGGHRTDDGSPAWGFGYEAGIEAARKALYIAIIKADALRKGEMAFRLDAGAIEREVRLSELTDDEVSSLVHAVVTAANLSQYEKSDTDRDQLREALDLAEQISGRNDDEHVSLTPRGWEYIYAAFDACRAALASKTAIDPVTIEQVVMAERERCAQIAETLFVSEIGSAGGQAIARAIRALGKDQ